MLRRCGPATLSWPCTPRLLRTHQRRRSCPARPPAEIIPFFQGVQLSADSKDVFSCYLELAEKVRGGAAGAPAAPGLRGCSPPTPARRVPPAPSQPSCGPLAPARCAQVRAGLGHLDPYFSKLADGMIAWIESWRQLNPEAAA